MAAANPAHFCAETRTAFNRAHADPQCQLRLGKYEVVQVCSQRVHRLDVPGYGTAGHHPPAVEEGGVEAS